MQNTFALIPSNTLLGKLLRLPLRLIPGQTVMTVRSGLNQGMKWIAGSSIHGCWLGTYELDKQPVIRRFVKPGMMIFDIGANAGFYTLAFSRLSGSNGHIWAFEPFAVNAKNILRHLELNNIGNVTLFQAAVTDKMGAVGFRIAHNNSMGSISEGVANYVVPTVSLDDLILRFGLPVPDLVKMDVEGAESLVLHGAMRLLALKKTTIFVALHGKDEKERCKALLGSAGYNIYRLDGKRLGEDDLATDEIYAEPIF